MVVSDFLERIEELYDIDDILYILGRDRAWLLRQIRDDLIEHHDDFFQGDEYYSEIVEDD